MSYRRTVIFLGLLVLVGFADRVPGQDPVRPIPTGKRPDPVKTAQLAEPLELDLSGPVGPIPDGIPGGADCPPELQGPAPVGPPPPGPVLIPPPGSAEGLLADTCDVIDPPAPQVRIRVRVPSVASPGEDLKYCLIVQNNGQGAAHQTRVRVTLPEGVTFVQATPQPTTVDPEPIWQLGTLRGCSCREITLVLKPTGSSDVRVCARVQYEHGQCVTTRIANKVPRTDDRVIPVPSGPPVRPRPEEPRPMPLPQPPLPQPPQPQPQPPTPQPMGKPNVSVKVTGPAKALLYDPQAFVIEVSNTGLGPARDATVTLNLMPGLDLANALPAETGKDPLSWSLGEIAPGRAKRIELQVIPKKTGEFTLDASAVAVGIDKQSANARVKVSEITLDIVVDGPPRRVVNSPAQYVIQVTNSGDVPATNVKLVNYVPTLIEIVRVDRNARVSKSVCPNPETKKDDPCQEVLWDLGTLLPGERREVRLELTSKVAGKLENWATVRSDRMERGVKAGALTEFEPKATGLTVEVNRSQPFLELNGTGVYTVRVINQGDGAVQDLRVSVTFPVELTPLGNMIQAPSRSRVDGQVVQFDLVPELPGRKIAEFVIPATAAMVGQVKIKVDVNAKQLSGPLRVEEATTIYK